MTTIYHNNLSDETLVAMARASVATSKAGDLGSALVFAMVFRGWLLLDRSGPKGGSWYAFQPGLWWAQVSDSEVAVMAMGSLHKAYNLAVEQVTDELREAVSGAHQQVGEEPVKRGPGRPPSKPNVPQTPEVVALMTELTRLSAERDLVRDVRKVKAVLEAATGMEAMSIEGGEWDADPWLLGVENGILDLRLDTPERFRPGRPEDMVTKFVQARWDDTINPADLTADRVEFIRFIHDLLDVEPEATYDYLMRVFGYSLTGIQTEKHWLILLGPEGNNGKSTLVEMLGRLLGPYAMAANKALLVERKDTSELDPNLADLRGRRLVWVSETKRGEALNVEQMKKITGDDTITTRRLYGNPFSFTPTHHGVLLTNHQLRIDANDKAAWNRLGVILLNREFVDNPVKPNQKRIDRGIKDRILANESSIVLRLLVEGCLDWQRRGSLDVPDCLLRNRDEYRASQDIIGRWLEERAVVGDAYSSKAKSAYLDYVDWCKLCGHQAMSMTSWGELMVKRFERKERSYGNTYVGFGLRDDTLPTEDDMVIVVKALRAANDGNLVEALDFVARLKDASARAVVTASVRAVVSSQMPAQRALGEPAGDSGTTTEKHDAAGLIARLQAAKTA